MRQTEKTAQEKKHAQSNRPLPAQEGPSNHKIDAELIKLTQALTRRYMSKVEIKGTQKSGQFQIQFSSKEEMSRIFGMLMGE